MLQRLPRRQVGRAVVLAQQVLDAVPVAAVLLLATWTVAYWIGYARGWHVSTIGWATLAQLLAGGAVVLARGRSRRAGQAGALAEGTPVADSRALHAGRVTVVVPGAMRVMVAVGTSLAIVLALLVHRTEAWLLFALGTFAFLGWQWWRASPAGPDRPLVLRHRGSGHLEDREAARALEPEPLGRVWVGGVTALATLCAVVSTQFAHPDGDDVYFVGFSTYVTQHGIIPVRDTLMSGQVFPAPMAYDPPLHSWEALIGLIARVLGVGAPFATYSIVLPVMVFVFVVALARLIRHCRVPWPLLGLVTSLGLLLLDGDHDTAFGFQWITRLWVGKIVLASVLMPLLMIYADRWLRGRRAWDLTMLVAIAVAALGVSSSAVFIIPLALAAAVLAGLVLRRYRAALLLIPVMLPSFVMAVMTRVLAPAAPIGPPAMLPPSLNVVVPPRESSTVQLLGAFALFRVHLVVFAIAVALGVLGLRSLTARALAVSMLAVFAIVISPPGNALLLGVLPVLASVLWRMWFLVPMPLLMAALPAGFMTLILGAGRDLDVARVRGTRDAVRRLWVAQRLRLAGVAVTLLAFAGYASYGPSVLSARAGTYPSSWGANKTFPGEQAAYDFVAGQARSGDVVLAPLAASRLVPIMTSRWWAVAPRLDYLTGGFYRSLPRVHAVDRLRLESWTSGHSVQLTEVVGHALQNVGVTLVCTDPRSEYRAEQLRTLGWERTSDGLYACYRRAA